jgi:SAM-dependent methyltransferase
MLTYHLNESVEAASRSKGFIDRSVEWIVSRFEVGGETAIADFGCGPGLYTARLAEKGSIVTGIDFSQNSIRYAKEVAAERGLTIDYVTGNYLEYETGKQFDLIMMIMCDFSVLGPDERRRMLVKFHALLKPGGSVLLDVHSMRYFEQRVESATYERNQLDGFWAAEEYYCFVNNFKYIDENVLLDKYTIIEASRRRVVYNWLQCYNRESLGSLFEETGFTVDAFYADVAGRAFDPESTEFAIVATK